MKTSKAAPQTSSQEECGVWLDTVQLKEKVKQKRLAPPISKLLNGLTKGGGYSLAVALNFTQTKMEMPKTKQSSISAFFTPKQKVLRKLSSTEAPTPDPVRPASPSTTTEPVSSLRKRSRESSNSAVDSDLEKDDMAETKATTRQDERSSCSALPKCESVEWKLPPCKRRPYEPSLPDDSQTSLQPWSQGSLFTCSEDSEELSSAESSFLDGVQNSEDFANLIAGGGKTSTQKPAENYCLVKDEKENSSLVSYKSPSKCISLSHLGTLSNHKWAELKNTSPQKQPEHSGNHLVKGHFNLLCRRSSPFKKKQKCNEADEASLASLFTQDSEGFRVIAHRGLQTRSPLKDQSNLSTGSVRSCAYKPLVKEEEDEENEMLFSQDSQGNMVIKH